ncbi:hypothetical protein [Streptomyces sp. NPDC088801]|uniref:hypothetical protein n=1 Tax=Streptomyces sp. NPDC088801 TaxID=3365903 RepID=UPI003822044E
MSVQLDHGRTEGSGDPLRRCRPKWQCRPGVAASGGNTSSRASGRSRGDTGRMRNGQTSTDGEEADDGPIRPVRLAPLKDGLSPEKRALAEDLRSVFLALKVSVRRYAARRHLDASSVTRYLNGERCPPWDFVAGVIADRREEHAPLTVQAERALRELHRAAQKQNRRNGELQELQDKLAEADEEARRITTRQRALEEALVDRESRLANVQSRCRNLEMRMEQQQLAQRAEVELWQGEYKQLDAECTDLQDQVSYLQEALAVTRAELIAVEDECHRLEVQLEAVQELHPDPDQAGIPSLTVMLEEADRTASVPELVRVVGDLELRTRQATAGELVRSASQSRTVEEVAGLLAALRQEGFDAHAHTALSAMVMVRPVEDVGVLARELFQRGFEDYVLTLLRASAEFHRADDVCAFVLALHRNELREHAESLLGAVAAVRPVADLVIITAALADGELDHAIITAMSTAAARRPTSDLVEMSLTLREDQLSRFADALQTAAATQRSASDVVLLMDSLTRHGLGRDADTIFDDTQRRGVEHLIALVSVLSQTQRHDDAWAIACRAAEYRPPHEIAALLSNFYGSGRRRYAAELLVLTLRAARTSAEIHALFSTLDRAFPGSKSIVQAAARISTPQDVAALLLCLERHDLPDLAQVVFQDALTDRPIRHLGEFLTTLVRAGSRHVDRAVLCHSAEPAAPLTARILLALASASLHKRLDAVVRSLCQEYSSRRILLLMTDLENAPGAQFSEATPVVRRILHHVVQVCSLFDQASLACALEKTNKAAYAELLIADAIATHGRHFKDELKKEHLRYERKGISRTLRQPPGPPVTPPPPSPSRSPRDSVPY